MNRNCIIYCPGMDSGKRLFNAMFAKKNPAFVMHLFTERLLLEEFIRNNRECAVVMDEESYYEGFAKCFNGRLIVLTEERRDDADIEEKFGEGALGIYRYQSFDKLYRLILEKGDFLSDFRISNSKLIGIYSPVEVLPREIFALNLCKLLAIKKRVLYINLRVYSGLWELLPQSDRGGLSDAIYYYRRNNGTYTDKIREVIANTEGFDYFSPIKCVKDISCIDAVNIIPFINVVAEECGYEFIVLDMGNEMVNSWMLMDNCDEIYMPVRNDYLSLRKISEFESYYCQSGMENMVSKIVKLRLPEGEECQADYWSRLTVGGMYRYVRAFLEQREAKLEKVGSR